VINVDTHEAGISPNKARFCLEYADFEAKTANLETNRLAVNAS